MVAFLRPRNQLGLTAETSFKEALNKLDAQILTKRILHADKARLKTKIEVRKA